MFSLAIQFLHKMWQIWQIWGTARGCGEIWADFPKLTSSAIFTVMFFSLGIIVNEAYCSGSPSESPWSFARLSLFLSFCNASQTVRAVFVRSEFRDGRAGSTNASRTSKASAAPTDSSLALPGRASSPASLSDANAAIHCAAKCTYNKHHANTDHEVHI